jgi:hypothetical protein
MTTKLTEKNISSVANAGISWQSVIVADGSTGTTGVAGRGYFINTTSAAHTFTLPATATFGDTILIKDYAGTFATFNLTINRNGHNIQGVANNSLISTNRASVVLVYVDVTRGWEFVTESNVADLGEPLFIAATGGTVTTDGNFKIHVFIGDGCFSVSQLGNAPTVPTGGPSNVDYLVVAGGGSAAAGQAVGGGGGAGGYRTTFPSPGCNAGSFPVTATTFPITVGAGGATTPTGATGNRGSDSIFSTITSTGGGAAFGASVGPGLAPPAGNGGSGGGANYNGSYPVPAPLGGNNPSNYSVFPGSTKGLGNSPPVSPSQGNPGGGGGFNDNGPTSHYGGGGGGGAGGVGGNFNVLSGGTTPTPLHGGDGGNGAGTSIFPGPIAPSYGTPGPSAPLRYFAGGGGAGAQSSFDNLPPTRAGIGGYGGGGCASAYKGGPANPWYPRSLNAPGWPGINGEAGGANTGGGGGSGGYDIPVSPVEGTGGAGGKGIVVIRYKFQ